MLPGFVRYLKDQTQSASGPSSVGRSNRNWPGQEQAIALNGIKGPGLSIKNSGEQGKYCQISDDGDANSSTGMPSSQDKETILSSPLKTVHIETTVNVDYSYG